MNYLEQKIRAGILNLSADNDDRFVLMVNKFRIKANYVKSVGMSKLKIARAINLNGYIDRFFNDSLIGQTFFMAMLDKYADSVESDVKFKVKSITICKDEIWCPELIRPPEEDIILESVIVDITDISKGVI